MGLNISRATSTYSVINQASQATSHFYNVIPLFDRIYNLTLPYLQVLTGLYYCGYGAHEMGRGTGPDEEITPSTRYYRVQANRVHGALYFGSGIADGFEALEAFTKKAVSNFSAWLRHIGNTCFFFANFIEMEANVAQYRHGVKVNSLEMIRSAIMGIVINVSYMAALALSLFNATLTAAIILTISATLIDGVKIAYDFYHEYCQKKN